ncbi:MAG TPA: AAA family ATPase, partial [Bacteroidetes bacterium]|nr:AAA family ATPase [Bacteroidota bacterium]
MAQVDSLGSRETEVPPGEGEDPSLHFDMTPEELERYLRQYVVRQEEAIEIIATKVATHFNRMRWEHEEGRGKPRIPGQIKPNILLIGPTGVGKTYIVKLIAERIGVPFVKGDATKFSETGYVGGDVEDMVRDLVTAAGGDIKLAEYGIIYIDEIDKIAASSNVIGPDVSRTGVQRNLLKLMEETEVELRVPHDLASQMEAVIETQRTGKAPKKKINTRNILFIVSGAFNGLETIIRRRLNRQPMGFGSDIQDLPDELDSLLDDVTTQDLIEYGFESEFIGRLPVIARLHELGEEGLYEVLTNEYNAVVQGKIRDFAAYGIKLEFTDEALRLLAQQAHSEKTGARGLMRVVERALIPFEKRLPSTPISKLVVTR